MRDPASHNKVEEHPMLNIPDSMHGIHTCIHMPTCEYIHIDHMVHMHRELLMNSVTPKASSLLVLTEAALVKSTGLGPVELSSSSAF